MFTELFYTKTKYRTTHYFKSSKTHVKYQFYVQADEAYVSSFNEQTQEWKSLITTEGWHYMSNKEITDILEKVDTLYE